MDKKSFGEKIWDFYNNLEPPRNLPGRVQVMNPFLDPKTAQYSRAFLTNFFPDSRKRVLAFGINPGRFGAGITGVTFTDPVALAKFCRIPNNLGTKRELSAEFVYDFIAYWGGPDHFYRDFFLTALSPLGYVKDGLNFNYYDTSVLLQAVTPFIIDSIKKQISLGGRAEAAISLGTGLNYKIFSDLNRQHGFFKKLYAVEHPRFIMQYKRRQKADYLKKYHEIFSLALKS